jgi:hypothetical protein
MIEDSKDTKHKIIAIDLLLIILTEFGDTITQSIKIHDDIIQPIFSILFKYIQIPNIPYGLLFHIVNLSVKLIVSCSKYYELLLPIIKWENMKYFALEVIGIVLASYKQIPILFAIKNAESNILRLLLNAIEKIIEGVILTDTSVNTKLVLMSKEKILVDIGKWGTVKPPEINQGQFLWLSINVVSGLIISLEDLNNSNNNQIIIKDVWKTIHKLLVILLKEVVSKENIKRVLIALQSFIKILANDRLIVEMNIVMQSVSRFGLVLKISTLMQHVEPYIDYSGFDCMQHISHKHILTCNAMFELALSLHSHFNQSSWAILFSAFQKLQKIPNTMNAKIIEERVKVHIEKYKGENIKHNCTIPLTLDKSSLKLNSLINNNKEQSDIVPITTGSTELEKDIMSLKNSLKNLFTLTSIFPVY